MKISDRKIVVVNQAANYLTIGLCNEFADKFKDVSLITGSIHVQGEELNKTVHVDSINKWQETHGFSKILIFVKALFKIYYLLITKYRKHEVFFISVPPMAYLLNLVVSNRFSMIIWDVYPDSFKITGMKETHIVYKVWAKLNTYSFKKAFRLYTIGDKMADLLATYVNKEKIIIQPIWSIFQENSKISNEDNLFIKTHQLTNQFIVQYSGNIGLTHKVEVMVELAEKMKEHKNILFQIIGRGPRVPVLKKMVQEKQLPNCQFLPFQSDELFPHSLSSADIGIVILDELTSKGSVPSKCYNLMSYGIPSLYIASSDSELNNYAKKYKHAKCFSEKNLLEAVDYILELSQNKSKYKILSDNSLSAANDFKRENACKFVEKYLNLQ
jgi:hypothetical protein